jgi:Cu-Zn family superoxide dismutase
MTLAGILVRLVAQSVSFRIGLPVAARHAVMLVAASVLAAAIFAAGGAAAQVPPVGATADVRDANGRLVATGEFREGRGEVLITIIFASPPALSGTHGLHIQETGRCDPPDFLTAGPDFNPTNKKHGRQNPDGPMVGDLPNVNFTAGLTSYNTSAPGATLGPGPTSFLSPNRALVVYSGEDDQHTDPDGKSGSRIACGVIVAGVGAPSIAAQPATSPVVPVAAQPTLPRPTPSPPPVQAVQPAAAQPVPARPASSPIVVPPPAVSKPATTPSLVAAASIPTPIVAPPTALAISAPAQTTQPGGNGFGTGISLIIAVLGVGLVAAGYLLRRRSQLR